LKGEGLNWRMIEGERETCLMRSGRRYVGIQSCVCVCVRVGDGWSKVKLDQLLHTASVLGMSGQYIL
jgi:hypothetical protein